MTLSPVFPLPLVIAVFVVLLAFVVWQLVSRENRSRRLSWSLRAAMVVLLLLVALRPGVSGGGGVEATTDVDVFFVVDTTTSIVAEDYDGSDPRLDGVRSDIVDLVEAYPGAVVLGEEVGEGESSHAYHLFRNANPSSLFDMRLGREVARVNQVRRPVGTVGGQGPASMSLAASQA